MHKKKHVNYTMKKNIYKFCAVMLVGTMFMQSTLPNMTVFAKEIDNESSADGQTVSLDATSTDATSTDATSTDTTSTETTNTETTDKEITNAETTKPSVNPDQGIASGNETTHKDEKVVVPDQTQEQDQEQDETVSGNESPVVDELDSASINPIMMMSLAPESDEVINGDLTFDPTTGTITGCVENPEKELVIPTTIGNEPVLHIADNVFEGKQLISISFADNSQLQSIGANAFYNNPGVSNIVFPDTLSDIGASAFEKCGGITSIQIPKDMIEIKDSTFKECTSLEVVTFLGTNVLMIGTSAFSKCNNLRSIVFPENLQSIGDSAFLETKITSVVLPEGLQSIGDSAFCDANITENVIIPDSVTSLGISSFRDNNFMEFKFGNQIKNIPLNVLYNCTGLRIIRLPRTENEYTNLDNLGSYGTRIFQGTVIVNDFLLEVDNNGDGIVIGYIGTETEITVPDSFLDGEVSIEVTMLDDELFYGNALITKVILPNSINEIGKKAFYGCTNLKEINLFNTAITEIKEGTFTSCGKLTTINFPEQLKTIGISAFEKTSQLRSVDLSSQIYLEGISDKAFYRSGLTSIIFPTSDCFKYIGAEAFSGYQYGLGVNIATISLPASLESIGESAFACNYALTEIIIPSNVTNIPASLFFKCSKLKSITFEGDITDIGGSFIQSTAVEEIRIPASVTTISSGAFWYATKLKTINIDKPEDSISGSPWSATTATVYWNDTLVVDGYIFSTKQKEIRKYVGTESDIVVPSKITYAGTDYMVNSLASSVFASNINLKRVDISKLTFLGILPENTFKSCTALEEVILPNDITEIGESAFDSCWKLNTVNLPMNLKKIGRYSFQACSALETLDAPACLTEIGHGAFYQSGITQFDFTFIEIIDTMAFEESKLSGTVILGDNLKELEGSVFANTNIVSITFPDTLQEISYNVLENCKSLVEVNMGNGVTTLGSSAFNNCSSLKIVNLSEKLKEIKYQTFAGCTSLAHLELPESLQRISTFTDGSSYGAFYNCRSLTSLILPDGITTLGSDSSGKIFAGSGITQLQIPSTVTFVGEDALTGMSALETVFVNQSEKSQKFHADSPWGAVNTPAVDVFYKGQAVVLEAETSSLEDKYMAQIDLKTAAEDSLIVSKIEYLSDVYDIDGNLRNSVVNVGTATWEDTVYVKKNGVYRFKATSSIGVSTEFEFKVDCIGKPYITADDRCTVTPSMIANKDLTSAELLATLDVTATDGVADLDISISSDDMAKINALSKVNPSTNIVLSATSKYIPAGGDAETILKTVSIVYLTEANIIINDKDGTEVLNAKYDTDVEVRVLNNADDSIVTNTYRVGYDNNIELPEAYEKPGHTFAVWTVTENANGTIDIKPTYTINTYTVTFNSQGGTNVAYQECEYNTVAVLPAVNPTRDEYEFGGWYAESECTNEYEFSDKITNDIILYARWNHVHNLAYTVADGVITATCQHQNEDCEYYDDNYIAGKLTLNTPASLVAQDGDKEFTYIKDANWEANIADEVTLQYYNGDTLLGDAPTTRGNYTVTVLVGSTVVHTKNYEITNAIIAPETVLKNYDTVSSSWVNTSITFDADNDKYTFSLEEDGTYASTITFSEKNGGTTKRSIYVKDGETGVVYLTELTYHMENTTPTFTVSGVPTTWTKDDVVLKISATDEGGSGLAEKPYSFDGGVTWIAEAIHEFSKNSEVTICVKDAAGNIADETISSLMVDQTAPNNVDVSINKEEADGDNSWYKSQVTHTLTVPVANDQEAPISSYYKLWKDGEEQPATGIKITENTILSSEDGKWNLITYTVDEAGNQSGDSKVYTWKQDITNPAVISLEYDTVVTFLDWILGKESVEITINVSDETSEAQTVEVILREKDKEECKADSLPIKGGEAKLTMNSEWIGDIAFVVIDHAGNESEIYCITQNNNGIIIEETKPTISITVPKANEEGWYAADVIIAATIQDTGISSGIKQVSYKDTIADNKIINVIDSESFGNAFVYTHAYQATVTTDGVHTIAFSGNDHAGNEAEVVKATEIKVDKTEPEIDILYTDSEWTNKDKIEVMFNANDVTSGVKTIEVSKGQDVFEVTTENGNSSFYADENGIYSIIVTDIAGNRKIVGVNVTKFDRTLPEIEWTNETNALDSDSWYGAEQVKGKIKAVESDSISLEDKVATTKITYVINEDDIPIETVSLLETGVYTVKATITDEAGNSASIEKVFRIETMIDAFNQIMENVKDNQDTETIAQNKGMYDGYSSLVKSRLEKNIESASNVERLLELFKENEEAVLLARKIQEITTMIKGASDQGNYGMNETVIARYNSLTEVEKEKLDASTKDSYDQIVEETELVKALIVAVNVASKPSSLEYVQLITIAEEKYNGLSEAIREVVPTKTMDTLTDLTKYRVDAKAVSDLPLLSFEQACAAKKAYNFLDPYAQSMVNYSLIEEAYENYLAIMEADEKALAVFNEYLKICTSEETISMQGIASLESSYNNLTEQMKNQLVEQAKKDYMALSQADETYADLVARCNTLVLSDRAEISTIVNEYNIIKSDSNKKLDIALIDNSIDINIVELETALNSANDMEAKITLLIEVVEKDGLQAHQEEIVSYKEDIVELSQEEYDLMNPDFVKQINDLYDKLITELEFNNRASSATSSVEIVGLTDKVELPQETADISKTVVKVVMKDSIPETDPREYTEANGKDLMISADIKLISIQTVISENNGENTYVENIQPKSGHKVLLKLELQSGYNLDTLEIVHVKDNGVRSIIPLKQVINENGINYAVFETESFSHFIVFAEKIKVPPTASDNGSNSDSNVVENQSVPIEQVELDQLEEELEEVVIVPAITEVVSADDAEKIDDHEKDDTTVTNPGEDDTVEIAVPQVQVEDSDSDEIVVIEKEKEGRLIVWIMGLIGIGLAGFWFWFFIIWKRRKDEDEEGESLE